MTPSAASAQVRRRAHVRRRAARRRRRALGALALLALVALGVALASPQFESTVRDLSLPLRHEDAIREQARAKGLDPALIAAVIYAESHFEDATSSAGALGLMQLMPETAHFIAERSGGTAFTTEDLSTPEINIAYGSWYLRYLLDHYDGDELRALAAYNGGLANVDRWIAEAEARGEPFELEHVGFGETRAYVERVQNAKAAYAETYARELGLR